MNILGVFQDLLYSEYATNDIKHAINYSLQQGFILVFRYIKNYYPGFFHIPSQNISEENTFCFNNLTQVLFPDCLLLQHFLVKTKDHVIISYDKEEHCFSLNIVNQYYWNKEKDTEVHKRMSIKANNLDELFDKTEIALWDSMKEEKNVIHMKFERKGVIHARKA